MQKVTLVIKGKMYGVRGMMESYEALISVQNKLPKSILLLA